MRRLRAHLTYANVVSTLCLMLALGGTAYASHLIVTTGDIVDASLRGIDFADGGLTGTDVAAGTVQPAQIRNGSVAYTDIAPAEAWQPGTLLGGWSPYGTGYAPAGYARDPYGIVRLRGLIRPTAAGTAGCTTPPDVFTLAAGYRPARLESHSVRAEPGTALVEVDPAGIVRVLVTAGCPWVSLEGVTFRAVP